MNHILCDTIVISLCSNSMHLLEPYIPPVCTFDQIEIQSKVATLAIYVPGLPLVSTGSVLSINIYKIDP
jgi:hypothetical protein